MPEGTGTAPASRREEDLGEMIRKAQENPGVREVMEVYSRAQATLTQAQLRTSERVTNPSSR